jgi:nicotinic acid phosphoribosyltransferase
MRRTVIFAFLTICTANCLFAQKVKEEAATAQYILRLHEKKFQWMIKKQLDSLKTILDERVVYIHSNGWVQDKKAVIEDLKSGKLVMNSVVINESGARIYKGVVIVNGKGKFNVVVDGNAVEIQLLYTEVYVKRKEGWLLVSRHANRLP